MSARAPIQFPKRPPEQEIQWNDYPRVDPGEYLAYCRFAKTYFDPQYRRWTCLLRWDILHANAEQVIAKLPQWFRLGDNPEKPHASLRGKYMREWTRASGHPPVKNDRLSPQVFVGRIALVEVADAASPTRHSVVKEIIAWETGVTDQQPRQAKPGTRKSAQKGGKPLYQFATRSHASTSRRSG